MHRLARFAAPIALALTTLACGDDAAPPEEPIGSLVEPGKADDFLSLSASEYWVEGTTSITLDATWAERTLEERAAEIRRLIPARHIAIGWFLNRYLVDKDKDDSYGGFKALTKNGSYEDLELAQVDELTWSFSFRQEVGGDNDLIAALPDAEPLGDGTWRFDLWIGKVSTADMQRLETDREWYRQAPWSAFDPSKVSDDQKELMPLTIRKQPAEDDAWLELDRLMDDGELTIGIHFGWDYHGAYHEKHSRQVYDWLVSRKGFESPVASWDALTHDAGPLTGKVTWRGRTVTAKVSLFWGRKGDATDPDTAAGGRQLEADMLESLAAREVVIFSGHSGPFYGFALANWKLTSEGDLDDSELQDVALWKDHYQLIVAEGCDTYGLGQAFALNPSKPGLKDLDVITTTSFSNAASSATVTDVLTVLLGAPGKKVAAPTRYAELLADLDANSYWFDSMYGVHGLDDNPHVHPWADLALACERCTSHAACGEGMRCVRDKDGERVCAAECTSSLGCGEGYACRNVQADNTLGTRVCAPASLSCAAPALEVARALVSEVMPNPTADSNADGEHDTTDDEYVEIVNAGAATLDLTGWTLSDGFAVRHRFPADTLIPPGGALVVFGGGTAELVAGTTIMQVASSGALGLNNTGDSVRLADRDGLVVAQVAFAAGLPAGTAWARERELDPDAAFATGSPSPGARNDGAQY